MEMDSTMILKCKHTRCNREAVDNGYCSDCLQLPHLFVCNYCDGISGNKEKK
jgi:hypothetical protein